MVQIEKIRETIGKKFVEEVVQAKREKGFVPDPAGFVVIHVDHKDQEIIVEHYDYKRQIRFKIIGSDAETLSHTLVERGLVSRLDHAAYIGRELQKAEIALERDLAYTQDKGLREKS